MNRHITIMLTAAVLLAGTSTTSFADEKEDTIQRRKENQQKRIAHYVENGSLTAKETANIEREKHDAQTRRR